MSSLFKLVATNEKSGIMFTAVPSCWENKNNLKWPHKMTYSAREALRSNSDSTPDDDWEDYHCIVKLANITSFQEALKLETLYSKCIDSDAEEAMFAKYTKNHESENNKIIVPNRNDVIENTVVLKVNETKSELKADEFQPSISNGNLETMNNCETDNIQISEGISSEPLLIIPSNQMKDLFNTISILNENINFVKEEQVKINLHLANIYNILKTNTGRDQEIKKVDKQDQFFLQDEFPLKACDDVENFNKKIIDNNEFKSKLINHFSQFGGSSGEENGGKIGFKLIDHIFSKEVLTNYTWTGISKQKKNSKKKAFNTLQGIVDVLYNVIKLADNHWNFNKTENFLRDHVLKQAKKRHSRHQEKMEKKQRSIEQGDIGLTKLETETDEKSDIALE